MKVLIIALQPNKLARFAIKEMERPAGQEIKINNRTGVQQFSASPFPFNLDEFKTYIPDEFDSKTMGQYQLIVKP